MSHVVKDKLELDCPRAHFSCFRMKKTRMDSTSSSSDSSSDSDDEMRSRLLAACVTSEMIKESSKKISKIKDQIIKVNCTLFNGSYNFNKGRAI